MELDFKASYLANSQAAQDVTVTGLKSGGSSNGKSFESTLHAKRNEAENEKSSSAREANKANSAKRREVRNEKDAKDNKESTVDAKEKETKTSDKDEVKVEKQADEKKTDEQESDKTEVLESPVTPQISLTNEQTELMISQIAEALGVTPQVVKESLEALDIKPEELGISENMGKLVMEVKGLKEPAELLTEPGMAETLGKLREIISNALPETEESEQQANVRQAAKPEAQQQTVIAKVNTEEPLKPQVNPEDGLADADGENAPKAEQTNAEGRVHHAGHAAQNNSSGTNQQAFGGGESDDAPIDETKNAPVIIQKGDETIVEVGGRTVSRTTARPAAQTADVVNQIIDKMKIDFKPGATEIKINLRPDELGNLTVKLVSEKGVVTAEIVTENSKVKELVEEKIELLRESLKEQGVEVGGLSVSVGQQENEERMKQFMREQTKSHARMSQIINKITGEEMEEDSVNYADEAGTIGYTVDYSA